ncbi:prepilin-type N-terminal cleavage/methylation domain-containing protein [bacterium]|nr:prepilin-type N-terminal cleavage/methylation domain-containing protein [bacterium]
MKNEKMSTKPTFPLSHFLTRKGFSLLELMVVITIIAILATTSLLFGGNFLNSTAVKNAKRDVASVMRMAHSKAGVLKINCLVVFDNQEPPDTQARVWVQARPEGDDGLMGTGDEGEFDADDPSTWKPVFGTERQLSKRVEIHNISVTFDAGKPDYCQEIDSVGQVGYLPFFWDGTSVSGSVKLQDIRGNNQHKVMVDYATSRTRLFDTWD